MLFDDPEDWEGQGVGRSSGCSQKRSLLVEHGGRRRRGETLNILAIFSIVFQLFLSGWPERNWLFIESAARYGFGAE
jgi:hypothetical protein